MKAKWATVDGTTSGLFGLYAQQFTPETLMASTCMNYHFFFFPTSTKPIVRSRILFLRRANDWPSIAVLSAPGQSTNAFALGNRQRPSLSLSLYSHRDRRDASNDRSFTMHRFTAFGRLFLELTGLYRILQGFTGFEWV